MFVDRKTQYCQMSVLTNLVYRLKTIPIKIPAFYFVDIDKWILKLIWRGKRLRLAKATLKENNEELTLPHLKNTINLQ